MKRFISATLAAAALTSLAGCAAAKTDQAAAAPAATPTSSAPVVTAPKGATQSMCVAARDDARIGDLRLDGEPQSIASGRRTIAASAERLARIGLDLAGRPAQYPKADKALRGQVTALAKEYAAAAARLDAPAAYGVQVAALRRAQSHLLAGCTAAGAPAS